MHVVTLLVVALFVVPGHVRVDITPGHAVNAFSPLRAIGGGVDAQNNGAVARIYRKENIQDMLAAGLGSVSYRLYTELGVQDWHWNPQGSWSDSRGRGYFTGSADTGGTIVDSYGFRLPHRGFTHDQANDDDYSRLDDGNAATYWKSDPYLTTHFTREPDAMHPQWVIVDLGRRKPVDAIGIDWVDPFALNYDVQYWTGSDAINDPAHGSWRTFPGGAVNGGGHEGITVLKLASSPIRERFVRVLMTKSSDTCDSHGSDDPRDCAGFAIAELMLGTLTQPGRHFNDLLRHRPDNQQTITYASSIDPWHAPEDRVLDEEQAGLDVVYGSGLTRGLPAMIPVGMLYGTPENAAAEIRYLEKRHDPISYVELGEEPDGQYVTPEDYGALYLQWATALHRVDPSLQLGGPVFQGVTSDVQTWPDASGDVSWLHRFLKYLSAHGRLSDLQFMSFEHYPFGPCDPSSIRDLLTEPSLVRGIMRTWRADGLPPTVPMFITETNWSAPAADEMQSLAGGLWFADFSGTFLAAGGSGVFLYQYEPEPLVRSSCNSWGSWGMFTVSYGHQAAAPASQFFAAQLLTQTWAEPIDAMHQAYPAESDLHAPGGEALVSAYALLRPDGRWSVMLINKDPQAAHPMTVVFRDENAHRNEYFSGAVTMTTFGPVQYRWHSDGRHGYASPDGPAAVSSQPGGMGATYLLQPESITVLTEDVR